MSTEQFEIQSEAAMLDMGSRISAMLAKQVLTDNGSICVVYLRGDLGAGKTTLVKGVVRGLGYDDVVTSPTYTLVENYPLKGMNVYHFDLYRLKSAEELEFLGIRDLLIAPVLALVEWPGNGAGVLPAASFEIEFEISGDCRSLILPSSLLAAG